MLKSVGMLVALLAVGALTACASSAGGPEASPDRTDAASPTPGASMSSTDLPTLSPPTAPPTAASDPVPSGTVAGRVSAIDDGCVDVTTDDGTVWSLTATRETAGEAEVSVGDTVLAKVEPLAAGQASCGSGTSARLVSISLVG